MANLPQQAGVWRLNLPGVSAVKRRTLMLACTHTYGVTQAHERKHAKVSMRGRTDQVQHVEGKKKVKTFKKKLMQNK